MNTMEIATTILNQMGGTGRLGVMIGAKNFAASQRAVQFRFGAQRRFNFCKVALNGDDTYTMEISRVANGKTGIKKTNVNHFETVYCDQLVELFERTTGLHLSL